MKVIVVKVGGLVCGVILRVDPVRHQQHKRRTTGKGFR